MNNTLDLIINTIMDSEGPYSNDPDDSGGKTAWGITKETALLLGYQGEMDDLSRAAAYLLMKIYLAPLEIQEIGRISKDIAFEVADTGVNLGRHRAAVFLQRCLNVFNMRDYIFNDLRIDGIIGPVTIAALSAYIDYRGEAGEAVLFRAMNSLQGAHYINLAEYREKDEKFIFGWFLNRIG